MKSAFQPDDLMAILDSIDDAVVKLDGQANFAAMNQAAANIYQRLGFEPQQMKGKSVWELFPDLKGTLVERELRQVIEDHTQISYEFFYPKDQRWYETKGYPASPGAILVFRDITPRKTAAHS
jgi:PAS domain S-box-containing protein